MPAPETNMIIGIPREIKDHEYRVALTPRGAASLATAGHRVLVQRGAGEGSGFSDDEYASSGAELVPTPEEIYSDAEMVVKVKEPLVSEFPLLKPGLVLFTYLHLAGLPELTDRLLEIKVTGIAYETVELPDGRLPLLTPMSEIAGRLSIQIAAHYLEKPQGGAGKLMGGVTDVPPANVAVLGAGVVGTNAASVALGMGAHVTLLAPSLERLRHANRSLRGDFQTVISTPETVAETVRDADVVIGAVLVPGAKAPRVVTREMVRSMRPGSVIVDVSVDQGGCVETTRPTTYSDPVYTVYGIVHYCVTNMPAAVPNTATKALTNVTLPYVMKLAEAGPVEAMRADKSLAMGLNTFDGQVVREPLGESLELPVLRLNEIL